ncbi:MAG: hemerythrin domain-containing protein [Burkholderiales bacterium]
MTVMEWNESLAIDHDVMDDTHKEFVDLLNKLGDAPDDQVLGVIDEFIEHTVAHFAQEERWMTDMTFPPLHCHTNEHQGVLEIAKEVRGRVANGETRFGRVLAQAVAEWFENHAASMDTVLSLYMKEQGYTPTVGA